MPRITLQPQSQAGPISPETVERWRAQGRSDDTIAQYMAQANQSFAQQYQRIRQASNGDPRATTAFLNTRFYGDAGYQPQSPEPRGFVGRTLDRIYGNLKQDAADVGQAVEDYAHGRQGFLNTVAQVGGNIASVAASPVSKTLEEAVVTGATNAARLPGVRGVVDDVAGSEFVQQGVIPAAQAVGQKYGQLREAYPVVRSAEAVAEGAFDAAEVAAGVGLAKAAAPALKAGLRGTPNAVRHPFQATGRAVGATARGVTAPFRGFASGVKQGFSGADDVARAAGSGVDDVAMEALPLAGKAKEAVDKGVDERLVRFVSERTTEERGIMKQMTEAAEAGTRKLGGTNRPKEIAGAKILDNARHVIEKKEHVGRALGNIAAGMGDETLDLTDAAHDIYRMMSDRGVVFSRETGKIIAAAGVADDEVKLLQKIAGFFQFDDQGRVVKTFRDGDFFRKKLFKELDLAKAKLAPTSGGQSVFSDSERLAGQVRSALIRKMGELNPNYQRLSQAYAELTGDSADFFKAIGYKGNVDDIGSQALRTGEVAMRVLGDASARPTEALQKLIDLARKYGYESNVDEFRLLEYADELENIFPITPTRSLKGVTTRAGRDVVEGTVKTGPIEEVYSLGKEKVVEAYRWARGLTPENRRKLLDELLDASPDESFAAVADAALPDESLDDLNRVVAENLTVDDAIEPVAATTPLSRPQVEDMLAKGQQVPDEVLAQYPDLWNRVHPSKAPMNLADDAIEDIPVSQIGGQDALREETLRKSGQPEYTPPENYRKPTTDAPMPSPAPTKPKTLGKSAPTFNFKTKSPKKLAAEQQRYMDFMKGKQYRSYGGGIDEILDVQKTNGGFDYTVKDIATGEVRTHGTIIRPSEIIAQ